MGCRPEQRALLPGRGIPAPGTPWSEAQCTLTPSQPPFRRYLEELAKSSWAGGQGLLLCVLSAVRGPARPDGVPPNDREEGGTLGGVPSSSRPLPGSPPRPGLRVLVEELPCTTPWGRAAGQAWAEGSPVEVSVPGPAPVPQLGLFCSGDLPPGVCGEPLVQGGGGDGGADPNPACSPPPTAISDPQTRWRGSHYGFL